MRQRSYLFLLLVLALGLLSGVGYYFSKYQYGLDIRGGVRFVYRMDTSKLSADQRGNLPEIRNNLVKILRDRAAGPLAVTEPVVYPKGADQFVIELPGFTNVQAAEDTIGSSARIEFYHAKTVVGPLAQYKPYEYTDARGPNGEPGISFTAKANPGKEIKFGDPAYKAIIESWGAPILAGDDLAQAVLEPLSDGTAKPTMKFSSKGGQKMADFTRANPQAPLAIVLDGKVLTINPIAAGQVLRDSATIEGSYPVPYVKSLVSTLNSGALPVDLVRLSSEKIDPTIGNHALDKIVMAGAISFVIIALFLIAYYAFPGVVALVALLLYVLFTLTVLKLTNATFSLAAIAGFILSVGMAVDANILVFERFKEEMKKGKTLQQAINLGFSRALPAIVDSNACTILTSLVLANLGTGPVKGFAVTLIFGVAISLFTAVFVTRSLLMFSIGSGLASNPKWFAVERNWFGEKFEAKADTEPMRVVESSKKWFLISLVTMVIGIPAFFMGGLKMNVEFSGGTELQYAINDSTVNGNAIKESLEKAGLKGSNVQLSSGVGNGRVAIITVPPSALLKGKTEKEQGELVASAAGLDAKNLMGSNEVGATIQQETIRNAVMGVVISSALIILYLALRFGLALGNFSAGLRFGFSAIGALVHDIFVLISMAALLGWLLGWELSALFITAMLTVIGFSVHDTIVIFDRIRENLRRPQPGEDFGHLVDRSISRSFARSINTSMTVVVTLGILLFAGTVTPDLKFFVAAMLIGIISGTYSSIYNASPILYLWDKAVEKKKGRENTLIGLALHEAARSQIVSSTVRVEDIPTAESTEPKAKTYGQVRRRANAPKKDMDIED